MKGPVEYYTGEIIQIKRNARQRKINTVRLLMQKLKIKHDKK